MKNEYRCKYLAISVMVRIATLTIIVIINVLVILWIENIVSLQKSIILNLIVLSLILEIFEVLMVILSSLLIIRLEGIDRKYKVAMITPLSIEVVSIIYYLIRLFGYSCFAPIITFFGFPFALISLICIKIIIKNLK